MQSVALVIAGIAKEMADLGGALRGHLAQEADQRQRELLLLEVRTQGFARGSFLTDQIEQIVGNLERNTKASPGLIPST